MARRPELKTDEPLTLAILKANAIMERTIERIKNSSRTPFMQREATRHEKELRRIL